MLIAGVVLVKDLYHMACVRIENVPSTSANNHVHPKAGKPMRQEPCCLMGAMASLGFSFNFTPSHVWPLVEHTRTILRSQTTAVQWFGFWWKISVICRVARPKNFAPPGQR